ncbi:S8 family serine peptidase [Caloranaerobacter ferrireducens]|uniref:S8 family serine peptidase n=1 Tax=Caloranaerobacter ferrireducens TaxID=1323370 RepID=UPI00084D1DE8|nr:S8 family serine peptidase [Caloranaerobacter ferrireducens]
MKNKRIFSILLVLAILIGTFGTALAAPSSKIPKLHSTTFTKSFNVQSITTDPRAKGLKDDDNIRIIVELEGKPLIEYATEEGVKVNELNAQMAKVITDDLIGMQENIKESIEESNINIEYHNSFVNVVNGFSATTTFKEAKKIEKIPGVKRVTIANEYSRPEPDMNTSKDIVKAVETWNLGYNGEGTVVAIIDTGIDPSHKDMKLTNPDKVKLSRESVEDIILQEGLPGKWFTDKVPYGYNYMDNNLEILDLGPDASMHGMHVAGIVGANGDEDGIKGIAPEAQLLAMKVFGNNPSMPSTFGDIIIRAIDDAVKLGADVINMSLGSTSAFVLPDDPEQQAVARAVENGVLVSISAGNSNHIGDGYSNPLIKNPDIGVVGSPGLTPESIQVASIENTHIRAEAFEYVDENDESHLVGYIMAGSYDPVEVFNGPIEYVYCGLGGTQEDFEGIDLEGKIALIQRGSYYFTDKIMNAQNNGAVGVIVFNHESGGESLVHMMYPEEGRIPAVFIGHSDGLKLLDLIEKGKNFVEFKGDKTTVLNPNIGKMSDFTSWGVTPDLGFKPEITAPGGQIYSTLQNDKYGIMSGTSMAAPHVSGGAALVLQRVDEEFGLTGIDRVNMAKNILMSTAKPNIDKGLYNDYFGLGNYTSPRRQGAGVMDLYAATTTPAVVTYKETGLSKVNLKEIGDITKFTLTVENFSDETVSYAVYGTVGTDLTFGVENFLETQGVYKNGTISPDAPWTGEFPITFELSDGTVIDNVYNVLEIPAGSSLDFDVTIDLTDAVDWIYNAPLNAIFPNGTFIEGFVRLVPTDDNVPELSIPYVGFYGEWDKVPIIDVTNYDANEDNQTFYGLTVMSWLDEKEDVYRFLGYTPDGPDKTKIAFSPNGDGVADNIIPLLSFLRNARELDINILDKDGNKIRDLAYEEYIRKNYYDSGRGTQFYAKDSWTWDGTANNRLVEDGEYIYEVKTRIDYPGSEWQSVEFPVRVDTIPPVIEEVTYDKDKDIITVKANDGDYPILRYELIEDEVVLEESTKGEFDVSKYDGTHEVVVRVYDCGWNYVDTQPIVIGDKTIPYIFIETPEYFGIYNTSEILVKGSVVDSSELVELKVNGEDVEYVYNEETGDYDFETVLVLQDGMHEIDIEAKDAAGNYINFEHKIFVDTTAPVINVTEEPTDRIVDYTVESINISADITENLPDLLVKVNGNVVKNISQDWSYFKDLEPAHYTIENYEIKLEYGDNIISIEAEDAAGNTTYKEYKVYRKQEGEEDPVLDQEIVITDVSVTPDSDISSERPVSIRAEANQEVDWEVSIVDPNNETVEVFNQTGTTFDMSWSPDEFKKLNGEYKVVFKATKGEKVATEEATFTVYNYPIKITGIEVIKQGGYVAIEASMENLGPSSQNPMLVIQVTDSKGYVVNISTVQMDGLQSGQMIKLSSGFGVKKNGTYNVDVYVWSGWDDTTSLSSPQSTTFVIK